MHVLFLENDAGQARELEPQLRAAWPNHRLTTVDSWAALQRHLADRHFDVVVLGEAEPGADLLVRVASLGKQRPAFAILVWCRARDEEFVVKAMRAGADHLVFRDRSNRPALVAAIQEAATARLERGAEPGRMAPPRRAVLERLAAGVAHRFNEFLTVIIGDAMTLNHRPDDPSVVAERARRMLRASSRAARLTRRLMALATGGDPGDRSLGGGEKVAKPAPEAGRLGASRTILLVEDDAHVRELAAAILRQHGHEILVAAEGREAQVLAGDRDRRIDLLVSDIVMPRMNGPELALRLRRERPDLRVLFISGYTNDALLGLDFGSVPTYFLPKPFTPQNLIAKVEALLSTLGDEVASGTDADRAR